MIMSQVCVPRSTWVYKGDFVLDGGFLVSIHVWNDGKWLKKSFSSPCVRIEYEFWAYDQPLRQETPLYSVKWKIKIKRPGKSRRNKSQGKKEDLSSSVKVTLTIFVIHHFYTILQYRGDSWITLGFFRFFSGEWRMTFETDNTTTGEESMQNEATAKKIDVLLTMKRQN